MNTRRDALILTAALSMTGSAGAQFVGDIFFEQPTVTVVEGDTAELIVNLFTGTRPHGGVAFDLLFNSSELVVEDVRLSPGSGLDAVSFLQKVQRVGIAAFNDSSTSSPIGTASIATIVVRPLGQAGDSTSVGIEPIQVVDANGGFFSQSNGFGATITVVPSSAPDPTTMNRVVLGSEPLAFIADGLPMAVLAPFGREIMMHELVDGSDAGTLAVTPTIAIDPDAPSDGVTCVGDTNGDGALTPADFSAWIMAFNSQSDSCDQNGDGECTPADFSAWIMNFNLGC